MVKRQFIILDPSLTGPAQTLWGLSTAGTETAGQSPLSYGIVSFTPRCEKNKSDKVSIDSWVRVQLPTKWKQWLTNPTGVYRPTTLPCVEPTSVQQPFFFISSGQCDIYFTSHLCSSLEMHLTSSFFFSITIATAWSQSHIYSYLYEGNVFLTDLLSLPFTDGSSEVLTLYSISSCPISSHQQTFPEC